MPRGSRRHPGQPERFLQVSQTRGAGALLGGEGLGVGTPRGNCGVSQCRCSASRGGGARRADWGPARGRGGPRLGVGRVAMELQPRPEGRGHEAGRHLSPVDAEPASAGSAWSPSTCWVSSEKRDRGELRAGTAARARPEAGAGSAFVGSSRPGEGAEAPGVRPDSPSKPELVPYGMHGFNSCAGLPKANFPGNRGPDPSAPCGTRRGSALKHPVLRLATLSTPPPPGAPPGRAPARAVHAPARRRAPPRGVGRRQAGLWVLRDAP